MDSSTNLGSAPYMPRAAFFGGVPTRSLDTPLTSVFLAAYILLGGAHMTIFIRNKKRNTPFIYNGMLFGFSLVRSTACSLRLAWAEDPTDVDVVIVSLIFASAGVIMLFMINILMSKRIGRAYHPWLMDTAWYKPVTSVLVALNPACLIMSIVSSLFQVYTLDRARITRCRNVQQFSSVLQAVLAFLPVIFIPLFVLTSAARKPKLTFGTGRWDSKLRIIFSSSVLLTIAATWRAAVSFAVRAPDNPGWYQHKACFYVFLFGHEVFISAAYLFLRLDRRFSYASLQAAESVPAGSSTDSGAETDVERASKTDRESAPGAVREKRTGSTGASDQTAV